MPGNIIPSFYGTQEMGTASPYDGEAFSNKYLRFGEVKRIVKPSDDDSRTKKFYEYDVLVQHRENDTADGRIYYACLNVNDLCGLSDKIECTLRIDDTKEQSDSPDEDLAKGYGSKVLILCLNGSQNEAVILGGMRDDEDSDDESLGHHYTWVFNGTTIKVEDDGSYSITVEGKTRADGQAHEDRVDGGGSSIQVAANGNITIATNGNKQSLVIDNESGTVTVAGDTSLTLKATQISVGENAIEPGVLGNQLATLLTQILGLCVSIAGGLPITSQATALAAQATALLPSVTNILSTNVTIK